MCSVKEGKRGRRSSRTEKKYDEPHLRDSAEEDAQISKKLPDQKHKEREHERNVSIS
jgi:hypothetical protein